MLMRSTGLGKTLLHCQAVKVESTNIVPETLKDPADGHKERKRLLMTIKTTTPVSWTVHAFVEPKDVRQLVWYFFTTPSAVWRAIRFMLFGGESPSVKVMKKKKEEKKKIVKEKTANKKTSQALPATSAGQ
ncbi:hypothetical protein JCM12296A_60590 [Desulfosarcina cetonica]|uniref:hypothetical protein n=1 Tax=Desulfosarcina cetonica TaxID=90730 RepID=UPI0006D03C00|nr:hypothetical protein [Desulfosarcina cetonica]